MRSETELREVTKEILKIMDKYKLTHVEGACIMKGILDATVNDYNESLKRCAH